MTRTFAARPGGAVYLVRASLSDDVLWDLVIATVTVSVVLNHSTEVDLGWQVRDGDPWTAWDPLVEPVSVPDSAVVLVADARTAVDDTLAIALPEKVGRVPVDEAAWFALEAIIAGGASERFDQLADEAGGTRACATRSSSPRRRGAA